MAREVHGLSLASSFPSASLDELMGGLLSHALRPDALRARSMARDWAVQTLAPIVTKHWDAATFPFEVLPSFAALSFGGGDVFGPNRLSKMSLAMVATEIARVDASFATFYLVNM